jgi:glutamate-5-semialdehyde dehydrogenase
MSIETTIQNMAKAAKAAAREIGRCSADIKNAVLLYIAAGLQVSRMRIPLGVIGISTSKLHAFGPMGLEELTTTKFELE